MNATLENISTEPRTGFKPFTWGGPDHSATIAAGPAVDLANRTKDITAGVRVILQILEHDHLEEEDNDGRPLLQDYQRGHLHRLAISSLEMLEQDADRMREWTEKHHKAV